MRCPTCQYENPPAAKFCATCRTRLPRLCPACGTPAAPDHIFCTECGADLPGRAAPASAPAALSPRQSSLLEEQFTTFQRGLPTAVQGQIFTEPEGENRVLTILFADLTGSVDRTAGLHPEDAAALVDGVLKAMVDAILKYEGRINRLLGDAVLAFFGTPVAHENDPERAILAALELRETVQALGLNVTAGINTGEVYLGTIGAEQHREITAQGPAVNLAARLREKAQPGQILVGETVYRHTRRAFEFTRQEVQAKGFAEPVPAYEVVRPLSRPEKVRGIEGLRASLIGRDHELDRLKDAWSEVQAGRGQIACVIGEAGVGKSRLIAELKDAALALEQSQPVPLWLEGRCLDVGMTVSYWPFLDVLRTYVGLAPEDNERVRGEHIARALETLVGQGSLSASRSGEMLPLLGNLLAARFGTDFDERLAHAGPEQIKHQTFLVLRDLLVALAQQQPLVLILEDLHWADSLSLDLISLLMETLTLAPLFLVCVYRPEREHKCWHLAAIAQRKCSERISEIHLKELTVQQSRRLVETLLHIEALPSAVKEQILTKTQGNPFFVEEVVRSLIDGGLVYHDGQVWRARQEITALSVPESVQSVILSRVDRLDGEVKHVLQSASVIGRLFQRRLLGQVTQREVELDRALAELEDRQLIYEERAIPEAEYSFQHALTQQTVYHNILRRRRAQFHREVAEALERLYGDSLEEHYEQLAHHYEQAGAVEKATEYQLKAGEKAVFASLTEEASGYLRRVLAQLEGSALGETHMEWMLAALTYMGLVMRQQGNLPDAERYLRRAIALGHDLQQPARALARAYFQLSDVLLHQGRYAEMVQAGEEGLALLSDETESTEAALMIYTIGVGHLSQGHGQEGRAFWRRTARQIMTLPYSPYFAVLSIGGIGVLLYDKDVAGALDLVHHLDAVAQHHREDMNLAGTAQWIAAGALVATGDLHGAVAHMQTALEYFVRADALSERITWNWLTDCYIVLGDLSRAGEYAEKARTSTVHEGITGGTANNERQLGTVALCGGALDSALRHLEAAVQSFGTPNAEAAVSLGRGYLAVGRPAEAVTQFAAALAAGTSLDPRDSADLIPNLQVLPNALGGMEEATDSGPRVRALVEHLRREHPAATLLSLAPCLEPALVETGPGEHVLREDFHTSPSSAWTWHDPFGDCSFAVEEGLHITAANGRDLWHLNLSAPRLLRPAPTGDFEVQVACGPAGADTPAIGGLLLWQDDGNYLALERGHWGIADIAFRGCLDNRDCYLGRGRLPAEQVWLRLERHGHQVRALCSPDGATWFTAGEIALPARASQQVGVHAIGMIDRTIYHGAYPQGSAIAITAFDLWTATEAASP